jgi:hypothetical protein
MLVSDFKPHEPRKFWHNSGSSSWNSRAHNHQDCTSFGPCYHSLKGLLKYDKNGGTLVLVAYII